MAGNFITSSRTNHVRDAAFRQVLVNGKTGNLKYWAQHGRFADFPGVEQPATLAFWQNADCNLQSFAFLLFVPQV